MGEEIGDSDLLMLLQASQANLGEHEQMREQIDTLGQDYHALRIKQIEMGERLKTILGAVRELIDRMPAESLKK
jgi:hypothetical protein